MKKKLVYLAVMSIAVAFTSGDLLAKAKQSSSEPEPERTTTGANRTKKVAALLKSMNLKAFNVYTDKGSKENHYIPSGYMGDYGDIKIYDNVKENPHSGTTCIKIVYNNKASQGNAWGGVYWQSPANNWGTRPGGFDLTGAKRVIFWARGEKGGELISEFKIGGISGGDYADSDAASSYDVELTKEWKKYVIELKDHDLSYISGGFCWAANLDSNPEGVTMFLDDIYYEF